MLFQQYIPGEDKPNEIIFPFPLEAQKNDLIDFHTYAPAINIFNIKRIIVHSVDWHQIYLIPKKMLQNRILPWDLNYP